jgi:hypothetical protein
MDNVPKVSKHTIRVFIGRRDWQNIRVNSNTAVIGNGYHPDRKQNSYHCQLGAASGFHMRHSAIVLHFAAETILT